jgi:hypothetical protein
MTSSGPATHDETINPLSTDGSYASSAGGDQSALATTTTTTRAAAADANPKPTKPFIYKQNKITLLTFYN